MRNNLTTTAIAPAPAASAAGIRRPACAQTAHTTRSIVASTEGRTKVHHAAGAGYRRVKTTPSAIHPRKNSIVRLRNVGTATVRVYAALASESLHPLTAPRARVPAAFMYPGAA